LEFIKKVISSVDLPVLSGDDIITPDVIKNGGKGVISVVANIIPKRWKDFISKKEKTTPFFEDLCQVLKMETNPQCIKYALSLMGKCMPYIRLPLIMPKENTKQAIENTLKKHKII